MQQGGQVVRRNNKQRVKVKARGEERTKFPIIAGTIVHTVKKREQRRTSNVHEASNLGHRFEVMPPPRKKRSDTNATLKITSFRPPKRPVVGMIRRSSIVRGEDDKSVVVQVRRLEASDDFSNCIIDRRHHPIAEPAGVKHRVWEFRHACGGGLRRPVHDLPRIVNERPQLCSLTVPVPVPPQLRRLSLR